MNSQVIVTFEDKNPTLSKMGVDESKWNAVLQTIFPGAKPESAMMAIEYCHSRDLDVMMKPVHIVPMPVKNGMKTEWRDVVMPGIGLYRIQADRSGNYAGSCAPEFGPMVTKSLGGESVTFPEWCKYTVNKNVGGSIVSFTAVEFWEENFATKKGGAPNSMWRKRARGQLAKCAEAQALRKAWPEIGSQPTFEEMEGKGVDERQIKDVTPKAIEKIQITKGGTPTMWVNAIAAFKRDGNLEAVLKRATISEEDTVLLIEEANGGVLENDE